MLVGLAVLVLAAAGHAVALRSLTGQLEAGFAAWVDQRRAAGWRISHGVPERGGWPWLATLRVPALRAEDDRLAWQVEVLELRLDPLHPRTLDLRPDGALGLRLGGQDVPVSAGRLQGRVPLLQGPDTAALDVAAEALRVGPVSVARGRLVGAGTPGRWELETSGLVLPPLPPGFAQALGPEVRSLSASLTLAGPWPPPARSAAEALAWREAGGQVLLHALRLEWGPLSGELSGTLGLDAALQPSGKGLLRVAGAGEAVAAAGTAGLLTPSQQAAARLAMAVMQRPAPDGGPPRVELPLALEQRQVSVAGFALGRLAPWTW